MTERDTIPSPPPSEVADAQKELDLKIEIVRKQIETGRLSPRDLEDARMRLKLLLLGDLETEPGNYIAFSK